MLNLCACMGPMYGEPYCYCEMKRKNLPLNEALREAERERFKTQWKSFMDSGGFEALKRKIDE